MKLKTTYVTVLTQASLLLGRLRYFYGNKYVARIMSKANYARNNLSVHKFFNSNTKFLSSSLPES